MKALKYFVFILILLIVGSCVYVGVQPSSYDIIRTKTIKAPVNVVFEQVNDYKKWYDWSPWVEKDSTLQFEYPEKTSGEGGSYSWIGKEGKGSMKTLAVHKQDSITQELQFEGMSPSTVYWKFNKVSEGTEVAWGMKADELGLIQKAFILFYGGMDKMIGPDYERGLEKLDSVAIESMNKFSVEIKGIKEYGGGYYLYKTTNATNANISQMMAQQYGSIGAFMGQNQIQMNGMPLTIYQEMNMDDGTVIMSNGLPVSEKIEINDDSGILCGYIPKTKVVKTVLKGNYTHLSKAWTETMTYIAKEGIELSEIKPFEIYTTDPGNYPNPADWLTEIYVPIKTTSNN